MAEEQTRKGWWRLGRGLLHAVVFLVYLLLAGVVFFPVINWLLSQTIAHEQLSHAFLVFLLSGALLVYERRIAIRITCQFTDISQNLLIFSYAVLVLAIFSKVNLIVLAALCLSLASFLLFLFGDEQRRLTAGARTILGRVAQMLDLGRTLQIAGK